MSGSRKFPERFPRAKMVKVKSSNGSIRIVGAQQNNITYTIREHVLAVTEDRARRELSHMKFTTYSSGDTVILQADCEGSNQGSIDFDIQVPAQTSLVRLETDGGSVSANGLSWQGRSQDRRRREFSSTGFPASSRFQAAAATLISAKLGMMCRLLLEAEASGWRRPQGMLLLNLAAAI